MISDLSEENIFCECGQFGLKTVLFLVHAGNVFCNNSKPSGIYGIQPPSLFGLSTINPTKTIVISHIQYVLCTEHVLDKSLFRYVARVAKRAYYLRHVRLSARISATLAGQIYVKILYGELLMKICTEIPNLVKTRLKYQALYLRT